MFSSALALASDVPLTFLRQTISLPMPSLSLLLRLIANSLHPRRLLIHGPDAIIVFKVHVPGIVARLLRHILKILGL